MDHTDHTQNADTTTFGRDLLEERLDRTMRPGRAFPLDGTLWEVTAVDEENVYAHPIGTA